VAVHLEKRVRATNGLLGLRNRCSTAELQWPSPGNLDRPNREADDGLANLPVTTGSPLRPWPPAFTIQRENMNPAP